jgi:hypothetical protein
LTALRLREGRVGTLGADNCWQVHLGSSSFSLRSNVWRGTRTGFQHKDERDKLLDGTIGGPEIEEMRFNASFLLLTLGCFAGVTGNITGIWDVIACTSLLFPLECAEAMSFFEALRLRGLEAIEVSRATEVWGDSPWSGSRHASWGNGLCDGVLCGSCAHCWAAQASYYQNISKRYFTSISRLSQLSSSTSVGVTKIRKGETKYCKKRVMYLDLVAVVLVWQWCQPISSSYWPSERPIEKKTSSNKSQVSDRSFFNQIISNQKLKGIYSEMCSVAIRSAWVLFFVSWPLHVRVKSRVPSQNSRRSLRMRL